MPLSLIRRYATEVAVFAGEEVVDALHRALKKKGIHQKYRWETFRALCSIGFQCTRGDALLAEINVSVEGKDKKLTILEGDEPVDVIYQFAKANKLYAAAGVNVPMASGFELPKWSVVRGAHPGLAALLGTSTVYCATAQLIRSSPC